MHHGKNGQHRRPNLAHTPVLVLLMLVEVALTVDDVCVLDVVVAVADVVVTELTVLLEEVFVVSVTEVVEDTVEVTVPAYDESCYKTSSVRGQNSFSARNSTRTVATWCWSKD